MSQHKNHNKRPGKTFPAGNGRVTVHEAKLLLLGDGGSGKTSLVKQLQGKPFDENEPLTHGIDIHEWETEGALKVNIWDFGGQEIMHAPHQFFLTEQNFYILVLDGRKDEKLRYWFEHIKLFGASSPVLVVINKIDERPHHDVNRRSLQEKYPNITGFFRTSCRTGQGIERLRAELLETLSRSDLVNVAIPASWLEVKRAIEGISKNPDGAPYLSDLEFIDLCRKKGVRDNQEQAELLKFLNRMGAVIHFNRLGLNDYYVLAPRWVSEAVYRLICSYSLKKNKGKLTLTELEYILNRENRKDTEYQFSSPPHYDEGERNYIITLMQQFEICYEIDRETILVPDLLDQQEPDFEFDYNESLQYRLDYDFLPPSLVRRYIVRMCDDIEADNLIWRNGMVLKDPVTGCAAVIKADDDNGRIYIFVQGDGTQKREYFNTLRKNLRDINRRYRHLKAIEKIPLPGEPHVTVGYDHLLLLGRKNISEYLFDGSEKIYNIRELLETFQEVAKAEAFSSEETPKQTTVSPTYKKHFNTAGPVFQEQHYCIEPMKRFDYIEIEALLQEQKYFVIHAPRQTGKTSYLTALSHFLNGDGVYHCLYLSVENAQAARENVEAGMRTILAMLASEAEEQLNDTFIKERWEQIFDENGAFFAFQKTLMHWCKANPKPIVLVIDEVDALVGDTLIALLRQLRNGHIKRPLLFPQSVILCGVRDIRDYRMHSSKEKAVVTGGSAFNVKSTSLKLGNFNLAEVEDLYKQHTKSTGQWFKKDVFKHVWELTGGQPWLVNALAYEACFKDKDGRDRKNTITKDNIDKAKETLIHGRETHLDQLAHKLREDRVRRVIEPILAGSIEAQKIPVDDIDYAADLGLIKKEPLLEIANPIYREIIPRELTYSTQMTIRQESQWYVDATGNLNMEKLLPAFQDFFRQHFESWEQGFDYLEAAPQLLLQAFLQRVVDSNGKIVREYAVGRQRIDLFVEWRTERGPQKIVLELKRLYGDLEKTIKKGLLQTWQYMDKCGASEGYFLVFDRLRKKAWEEKIFCDRRTFKGQEIVIYGM